MEPDGKQSIRIGLTHFPVLSLGPGLRVGIWLAGCPLRCAGCVAPEWQAMDSGHATTVSELLDELLPFLKEADGVTISGGEPFAQPVALEQLLIGLRRAGVRDILAYSGYCLEQLRQVAPQATALLDALVDGPFRADLPTSSPWRGSSNQRLHILTGNPELRRRYRMFERHTPANRLLQCIPKANGATLIGIPRPDDIKELRYGTL